MRTNTPRPQFENAVVFFGGEMEGGETSVKPPKFNSSPLKNGGKGRQILFHWGFGHFSGANS